MNDQIFQKIHGAIMKYGKYKNFSVIYAMNESLDSLLATGQVKITYAGLDSDILVNPTYLDAIVAINDIMNMENFGENRSVQDIELEHIGKEFKIYSFHLTS